MAKGKDISSAVKVKNLSDAIELSFEGSSEVVRLDFTDRRVVNGLLGVLAYMKEVVKDLDESADRFDDIEDRLDRLIAVSNYEVEVLTNFHHKVNAAFGCKLVENAFGVGEDAAVDVRKYVKLFDMITPYLNAAMEKSRAEVAEINEKYGFGVDANAPERQEI